MKNLMVGKHVLSLLIALVLAFGVVGVADAISEDSITIASDSMEMDLASIAVNSGSFNVELSLALDTAANITDGSGNRVAQDGRTRIDSSGYKITMVDGSPYRNSAAARGIRGYRAPVSPETGNPSASGQYVGSSVDHEIAGNVYDSQGRQVFSDTVNTPALAKADAPVPVAQQQHYNEQAIKIDIPSGIILTSHSVFDSNGIRKHSDVTLTETVTATDGTKFMLPSNGTVNVQGYATSVGEKTFTIRDETPSADRPSSRAAATPLTFTIYVTESDPNRISDTTSITLRGLRNGYSAGNFGNNPVLIYSGSGNYPVTYAVTGGGMVYVQKTSDRKTTGTTPLSTSSAATVYLDFGTTAATQTVTATVTRGRTSTGVYIYGSPTLTVGYPSGGPADNIENTVDNDSGAATGTEGDGGAVGSTLMNAITATVNDGVSGTVQGVIVKFEAKGGTYDGGNLIFPSGGTAILVNRNGIEERGLSNSGKILYVLTSPAGEAKVNFRFGEASEQKVVVTAIGESKEVSLFSDAAGTAKRLSAERITSSGGKSNLRAIVRNADGVVEDEQVRFRITTGAGELDDTPDSVTDPTVDDSFSESNDPDGEAGTTVYDATDENGVAHVIFTPDATYSGSVRVTASIAITDADGGVNVVDSVDFNVRGGSPGSRDAPQPVNPYLSISVSPSSGTAGTSGRVTVSAFDSNRASVSNVPVTLSATGITFSPNPVLSGSSATFTFPSSTTSVTATANTYRQISSSITVTTQGTDPTLALSPSTLTGSPAATVNLSATVQGRTVSGVAVTFTLSGASGGAILNPVVGTNTSGVATARVVLPGTSGGTVTASATVDGTSLTQSVPITVTGTTGTGTGTPTTPPEDLTPAQLTISGGSTFTGEVNRGLDDELTVRIVNSGGNGVSSEVVFFRVTQGSGRLAPSRARTDSAGYASTGFTPRSTGTIEVEATSGSLSPVTFTITTGDPPDAINKISGDDQSGRPGATLTNPFVVEVVDENDDPVSGVTVTFEVTAGEGSLSTESVATNNNGRAQTTLTLGDEIGDSIVLVSVEGLRDKITFTASAGATVVLNAANRAPIYWIDKQNGTLHRLVDDEVENLASNVEGVTSLAVDEVNGLIYWGVQVGRSGGKIQRSRLNGRNVQTLKDRLTSIPMGIALDAAGGTIYWTSASGKIRSMATEGSTKVTKILEDLSDPMSLAVSNGYLYWAEPLGRVRRVSLTASQKVAANIATGLGEPLSIAIAKGKIYWVERSGSGGGALQRANLDGTKIEELKAFTGGVPLGISIDSSANKIYWTKLSKIQRTNLAGRSVIDVVTGLTRPGAIALGVAAAAEPTAQTTRRTQTTQTTTTTTTTTYSKYDINKDGVVNNADTKAVAGAVGQSGTAITNRRTDVDGSGTVDVTDLILVIANLDDDVAAPAIDVDLTAMDLDFDRVAEQVEVLLASGDRSHAAQRALLYLQHLLASARPDATVLLANYPNPFNPETWIPYHLATSTDVKINIYNAQGILVRALTLGHQSAGYYTSRSRAAYWDGRNALGERVASGIYFYQLQADEISPLRKMVILK